MSEETKKKHVTQEFVHLSSVVTVPQVIALELGVANQQVTEASTKFPPLINLHFSINPTVLSSEFPPSVNNQYAITINLPRVLNKYVLF